MAERRIAFRLNGREVSCTVRDHETLAAMLRDRFQLYSVRESCVQGLCGCCTVIVDGRAVSGCLYLAPLVDGKSVETVEGLGEEGRLDPVQTAFIEHGAFQCGFCTPGMVLMSHQLLQENPQPDQEAIAHYLSGNLCRCATYPEIVEAVRAAAQGSPVAKEEKSHG